MDEVRVVQPYHLSLSSPHFNEEAIFSVSSFRAPTLALPDPQVEPHQIVTGAAI